MSEAKSFEINKPSKGLNKDIHPNMLGEGLYTHALNVKVESEDGSQINITNEPSNIFAVKGSSGYKVIGVRNIVEVGKTFYWLVNPSSGDSEIGYIENDITSCLEALSFTDPKDLCRTCDSKIIESVKEEDVEIVTTPCMKYVTIINDKCLNFSINYPIHEIEYKITNESVELYWTDDYNPPRWIDINKIPKLPSGELNCNLLKIFPENTIPSIELVETPDSGSLLAGSYEFWVAYANAQGEPLSQYYSVTNPVSIWENKIENRFNFPTGKAIKIAVSNLDTQYRYINIVVTKQVGGSRENEIVGTYDITSSYFEHVYTGNDKALKDITNQELYFRSPFYTKAGTVCKQNNILMWGNLETEERISYQKLANRIKLVWETHRLPYNEFESYNNPVNTANLRGYMRDEVYAFDIVFLRRNGRYTDRFHIPGRPPTPYDLEIISNDDANNIKQDSCDTGESKRRWEVYNTGSLSGLHPDFKNGDRCYKGPYQYGEFSYWHSTETYPNNPDVWGDLAGQPIRHHKFPDCGISPIHDDNPGDGSDLNYEHAVYPMGVRVDSASLHDALYYSGVISKEMADDIVGFKILRSNRRGTKSILGKGFVYNVGRYSKDGQGFLYPNYPFNDINPDPFLSDFKVERNTQHVESETMPGNLVNNRLKGFDDDSISKSRFTFHSPDMHFYRPSVTGSLKLETIEYGKASTHIVKVENNARYTLGTKKGVKLALSLAMASTMAIDFGGGQFGSPALNLDLSKFINGFNTALDLVKKLIPFREYGYQYNGVGNYCKSVPVPNDGNKIRTIDIGGYMNDSLQDIGDIHPVNNYQRESSVYLKVSGSLPYTHERGAPRDNTRWTISSANTSPNVKNMRDISCYYASVRRNIPDQYGQINSYTSLDTGKIIFIERDQQFKPLETVFGGDIFINRFAIKRKLPFFLTNTVGQPDDSDIFYNELGNVGYPTYYLSTGPVSYEMSPNIKDKADKAYEKFTDTSFWTGLVNVVNGGADRFVPGLNLIFALVEDVINFLGVKNANLDSYKNQGYFEEGYMYLFAYGIPYFFVESDINIDYRQATNATDENFYPNVGNDIPDFWLQEKNVSITKDNKYNYNSDFLKQSAANLFTHLPIDFDVNKYNVDKHSTRVIYSEPTNLEEKQNNWLVYKPNNYKDFGYDNGPLIDLQPIEQDAVLARFENNMVIYNAFATLATNIRDVALGTGEMFKNPPKEFFRTNTGYGGTQNKAFCSTKYGHFWADTKRGDVFMMSQSGGIVPISENGLKNWFKENLTFQVKKYIKNAPVDNAFKDIGISMVWDNRYNRLIITKKDYIPLDKDIYYDDTAKEFKTKEGVIISPKDSKYFCDASWTIAYSPVKPVEAWISFYSYKPDFYVEQNDYFQSGINTEEFNLYNHLLTNKSYQLFYNEFYPFEIEFVTKPGFDSKHLSNIAYSTEVLRYKNSYDFREMSDITFTDALITCNSGTSGELELKPYSRGDMNVPSMETLNGNKIVIPVIRRSDVWRFNKITNVLKDSNSLDPILLYKCNNAESYLNPSVVDLTAVKSIMKRERLSSDWFKIRMSNRKHSRYKFLFKWLINKVIN